MWAGSRCRSRTASPAISSRPSRRRPSARWGSCTTRRWASNWAATARSTCARTSSCPACCATGCGSSCRWASRRADNGPRVSSDVMKRVTESAPPLILVSNRGPVEYTASDVKRGSGGLVTALTGLASHHDAIWVASAMSEQDVEKSEQEGGRPFVVRAPGGGEYRVRFVASEPDAYDRFYNVFANPMLWFIQHYLWDLSNAPDIRRHEVEAFEFGYNVVNEDLARAVIEEIDGVAEPVVMVHDYHLYTLPALVRQARPDAFLHHFVHIPWTQSDAWRVLPGQIRDEIYNGLLANDIIGFHTRSYRRNFLQCCRDLMGYEVDFSEGIVWCNEREVW